MLNLFINFTKSPVFLFCSPHFFLWLIFEKIHPELLIISLLYGWFLFVVQKFYFEFIIALKNSSNRIGIILHLFLMFFCSIGGLLVGEIFCLLPLALILFFINNTKRGSVLAFQRHYFITLLVGFHYAFWILKGPRYLESITTKDWLYSFNLRGFLAALATPISCLIMYRGYSLVAKYFDYHLKEKLFIAILICLFFAQNEIIYPFCQKIFNEVAVNRIIACIESDVGKERSGSMAVPYVVRKIESLVYLYPESKKSIPILKKLISDDKDPSMRGAALFVLCRIDNSKE